MKKNNIWKSIPLIVLPLILFAQGENWVYRYANNGDDKANSIVYGADGNIYAAGYVTGSGNSDIAVISLTTAGDTNWVYTYNGPGNSSDNALSIVYGADGNIYAAGFSSLSHDIIVISLTSTGDTNWIYTYNGPGNNWDTANSIVYGLDGNLYVAGNSIGNGSLSDIIILSLTTAGDTNWVYRYSTGNHDWANAIVYGSDGNIYAAGSCNQYDFIPALFIVVSLTAAGDTNWIYTYGGPGHNWDEANSIVYGADGNIYAAGRSTGSGTSLDFIVISLTTAGDTNWIYRYNGSGNNWDEAKSIVYGADGNIYAAGWIHGAVTGRDFSVISLTTAGDTNWIYRYNGPGNSDDESYSIVYGADGNIYAAGRSTNSGSNLDFTVISLTTAGDTNWVYRYNGPGNGHEEAKSIVYGADGNIYASGSSFDSGTGYDFTVISLPPDCGIEEENAIVRDNFYGTTIFSGPLILPKDKKYRVFDVTGRIVEPKMIKPGIYFIEIDGEIAKKVVKVR